MDRDTLFKHLAEHYALVPDTDWWQHRQSRKWVLTHSAVQKIAYQETPEGYVIQVPGRSDIDWIKKGDAAEGGMHGPEVVIGAEFRLMTTSGKVIRKVYAIGEANCNNVNKSLAYPWAMAWKRMFDRGVLDVLAFASHGFYSAEEADTFNDPSQRVSVKQEAAPTPAPVAPAPQPVAPQAAAPKAPQPRAPEPRAPEPKAPPKKVEAQGDDVVSFVEFHGGNVSKSEICNHMGWEPASFLSRIKPLIDSGALIRTGQKRGTRYSVAKGGASCPAPPAPISAPLTQQEYHVIWRDVSERLRSFGMSQLVISRIVREVTGHESAIAAHQNGSLTKESVDKIFALGQRWSASINQEGGITHGL
tara:strand:- start:3678 stop:4757 length:1080 start_codon:yes stop_codon:yes gene_type:complete